MKLRVSVQDKVYEVGVETIPEAREAGRRRPTLPGGSAMMGVKLASNPRPVIEPWQGLGTGGPGEVCAPMAGKVTALRVKPGEPVKQAQAIVEMEATKVIAPGDRPFAGTLRTPEAGIVREVLVKEGDTVTANQVLVRLTL
ncbi:MAG: acetyl-CoA carboxylase biotin carboxyl carrier protein subunit [Planctomycetota bacterium]|nr:acetyl-CoA carboxylase biotin carboxyl carrier protein subunit [Planctomycetota bacterium]